MTDKITSHIYWYRGSTNGAVLLKDGAALLLDAPETAGDLQKWLGEIGVKQVEAVLLTQHRRAHSGGLVVWPGECPPVWATEKEKTLLEKATDVWTTGRGKYHRYEAIPDRFSPFQNIPVDRVVKDGETIHWHGLEIRVLEFAALSHGDCGFLIQDGKDKVFFSGALAMAGGKIPEVASFQKALPNMMGYHGFLAGLLDWCRGMERVRQEKPNLMLPAYGPLERDPVSCLTLLEERLRNYAESYVRISAVRYYFPQEYHQGFEIPMGMTTPPVTSELGTHPEWLFRIGETTSYLILAPSGRAILIDTGDREALEFVQKLQEEGRITHVDACWITHAHDDHLNTGWKLMHEFDCDVITTAAVAEVCGYPAAWFLPALPDCNMKFRVLEDGYCWDWEGFTLTSMHLPGQCVAHSGLLVERDGQRILLCGDSFAPTGLDDYCAENRNLPGPGRGYDRCLKLLERYGVRQLVNQHQTEPFLYDEPYIAHLKKGMADREENLRQLLPGDIGLGLDRQWIRAWPMEQQTTAGATLRISAQVTGHGKHKVTIRPRLPWTDTALCGSVVTEGLTSGTVTEGDEACPPDTWVHFDITAPEKGFYVIPYECWLDDTYLGSFTNCTIEVV